MGTVFGGARILAGAESDVGILKDATTLDLHLQAIERAVAIAGIEIGDIDGISVSKSGELQPGDLPAVELAQALGVRPTFADTTLAGGAGPVIGIARAAAAITSGQCRFAVVSYASTQASRRLRRAGGWAADADSPLVAFEQPTGYRHPVSIHALIAARHMHEYGSTSEQFAAVAVAARRWAALNPAALKREPLTIEDVLASRVISSPLHALDCCLVTDGGGAIVLGPAGMSASRRLVSIAGFAELHSHQSLVYAPNPSRSGAADTGPRALAMAGRRHADVDVVQLYDAFTNMPIMLLEDIGFFEKGRAGQFVLAGGTAPGGELPMNTQGGGLAHCHPGMYGIFLAIEATRQLQGAAGDRQVSGADLALCHGAGGGGFGIHATLVLEGA